MSATSRRRGPPHRALRPTARPARRDGAWPRIAEAQGERPVQRVSQTSGVANPGLAGKRQPFRPGDRAARLLWATRRPPWPERPRRRRRWPGRTPHPSRRRSRPRSPREAARTTVPTSRQDSPGTGTPTDQVGHYRSGRMSGRFPFESLPSVSWSGDDRSSFPPMSAQFVYALILSQSSTEIQPRCFTRAVGVDPGPLVRRPCLLHSARADRWDRIRPPRSPRPARARSSSRPPGRPSRTGPSASSRRRSSREFRPPKSPAAAGVVPAQPERQQQCQDPTATNGVAPHESSVIPEKIRSPHGPGALNTTALPNQGARSRRKGEIFPKTGEPSREKGTPDRLGRQRKARRAAS